MIKGFLRVSLLALVGSACASVPPPVTRSPQSPAHPEAAEAVTPPLPPVLMSEAGRREPPSPSRTDPHAGHGVSPPGHSGGGAETSGMYSCPMHAQVKSDKSGTCPVCGMALVKKNPNSEGGPRR